MQTFSAQVRAFTNKAERRLLAVHKQSAQDVIDLAQTTVNRGGRMRVDTGFLRASGAASLGGLPFGDTQPADGESYTYSDSDVALVINQAGLGDTVFFGWTANYARPREARDGFLRTSAQMWQAIVSNNVNRVQNV